MGAGAACAALALFFEIRVYAAAREQIEESAMRDDEFWRTERRLWLDSVDFFEKCVGPDALLVVPEGIMGRRAGLAAARSAPPWHTVSLSAQRLMYPHEDLAILAYEAFATRAGRNSAYNAYCSSMYVRARGSWLLVAHQQAEVQPRPPFLTEFGALKLFFAAPDT